MTRKQNKNLAETAKQSLEGLREERPWRVTHGACLARDTEPRPSHQPHNSDAQAPFLPPPHLRLGTHGGTDMTASCWVSTAAIRQMPTEQGTDTPPRWAPAGTPLPAPLPLLPATGPSHLSYLHRECSLSLSHPQTLPPEQRFPGGASSQPAPCPNNHCPPTITFSPNLAG